MKTASHIALLVRSVDRAAQLLAGNGYKIGPREEWEGEGTAEIYVGDDNDDSRLLLMEPIGPGAYQRAMQKRGPGLHHIAIDVPALQEYVVGLGGTGWFLHPKSVQTIPKTKTAWLARPGMGLLIEVQERDNVSEPSRSFVSRIEKPMTKQEQTLIAALGVQTLTPSEDGSTWLVIGEKRIDLAALVN